jgi:arylsulfatase A-like enzyme/Flp pilus assembly protein TadD
LRGSNVLLITIDTLRADRIGAYGGGTLTPALDRLAASGVRFADAHAHAPLTLPAHTSILTGLVPATHGVHDNGARGLDPQKPTLAERLRQIGYRTGAFVGSFVLDARFGLSRGFDIYDDRIGSEAGPITLAFTKRSADRVTKVAGDWILDQGGTGAPDARGRGAPGNWFAWIHLFDPHAPYHAPDQRVASPYDNEVAYVDAQIGRLLDRLRPAGQLDRTVIIVLADHGESLGEHGEATHGLFAYDATLRIPLVIAGPSIHADVVRAPLAQADVLPTLFDLLGADVPSQIDGHSALPAVRGEDTPQRPIYFEALEAYLTRNWAPLTGVIEGGWKYIDLPEAELYDLVHDPGELHNLIGRDPARADALHRRLAQWNPPATAFARAPAPIDPDAAARLRALGYTATQGPAGTPRKRYGVEDDPKRLLDLDRRYERALTLTGARRYDEAVALLRSVIAERSDFAAAYTNLAAILIQSDHPADAVSVLENAIKNGVATPEVRGRLGAAYLASGKPGRAVELLEPLAIHDEGGIDGLNTLGIALAQLGRHDRARQLFERVVEQSPASATTWNNLGLLELADHRLADAARAFQHCVAVDPDFGQAWQGMGAALLKSDLDGAIEAWRHAVVLLPHDYDLLFNLAALLHDHGREEDARPYLERFVREAPASHYASDIAKFRAWLAAPPPLPTAR